MISALQGRLPEDGYDIRINLARVRNVPERPNLQLTVIALTDAGPVALQ